jgi:RNA processing factor Prp31
LKHIDTEIFNVHTDLRKLYWERFGELEKIILNPLDYAKAVQIILNATDLTKGT